MFLGVPETLKLSNFAPSNAKLTNKFLGETVQIPLEDQTVQAADGSVLERVQPGVSGIKPKPKLGGDIKDELPEHEEVGKIVTCLQLFKKGQA